MMQEIDLSYMTWLYSRIERVGYPSYYKLMEILFNTEFNHDTPNDDNRAAEGLHLRRDFLEETGKYNVSSNWIEMDCSMLEMLVALSERMSFLLDQDPAWCFWSMLENVELDCFDDDSVVDPEEIEDILETINMREYDYDGTNGLFPLENPSKDQREEELLYQMYAYIQENVSLF